MRGERRTFQYKKEREKEKVRGRNSFAHGPIREEEPPVVLFAGFCRCQHIKTGEFNDFHALQQRGKATVLTKHAIDFLIAVILSHRCPQCLQCPSSSGNHSVHFKPTLQLHFHSTHRPTDSKASYHTPISLSMEHERLLLTTMRTDIYTRIFDNHRTETTAEYQASTQKR